MNRLNCWEYKKCGRQLGGINAGTMGVCPAFLERKLEGEHHGRSAGRACWVVAGTFCGNVPQGTFAEKYASCQQCDFYKLVKQEEGAAFRMSAVLLQKLREGDQPNSSRTH